MEARIVRRNVIAYSSTDGLITHDGEAAAIVVVCSDEASQQDVVGHGATHLPRHQQIVCGIQLGCC